MEQTATKNAGLAFGLAIVGGILTVLFFAGLFSGESALRTYGSLFFVGAIVLELVALVLCLISRGSRYGLVTIGLSAVLLVVLVLSWLTLG